MCAGVWYRESEMVCSDAAVVKFGVAVNCGANKDEA